jgi:predicted nucleic acid-binding protein
MQERGLEEAQTRFNLLESLPISRIESTVNINIIAAKLKAKHHISVADAWIAALAMEKNAILIHKDPEFEAIQDGLQVLQLPYKC